MKGINHRITAALLLLGILSLSCAAVRADDTEIYIGSNAGNSDAKPNVAMILDTSGSMGSGSVTLTVSASGAYDPNQTYGGSCNASYLYWVTGSSAPTSCPSTWVQSTVNSCADSTSPLSSTGKYSGNFSPIAVWTR